MEVRRKKEEDQKAAEARRKKEEDQKAAEAARRKRGGPEGC